MPRKVKFVSCKRCRRTYERNSEVGRHVRDGGYCVRCKAETTRKRTYYGEEASVPVLELLPEEHARYLEMAAGVERSG